jgi:hypothetical protein
MAGVTTLPSQRVCQDLEANPARVSNQVIAKVNNSSVGKASGETEAMTSETLRSIYHSHSPMRHGRPMVCESIGARRTPLAGSVWTATRYGM